MNPDLNNFKTRKVSNGDSTTVSTDDEKTRPTPPVDETSKKKKFDDFLKKKEMLKEEGEIGDEEEVPAAPPFVATPTTPIVMPATTVPVELLHIMKEEGLSIDTIKEPLLPSTSTILDTFRKVSSAEEALVASTLLPQKTVETVVSPAPVEAPKDPKVLLQSLIDICAKAISEEIMPADGKDIVKIELKLPLFEGATVEITQYRANKNDFAVTFYNLTNPDARALIEKNENVLRSELARGGYMIQMLTIEPKIEATSKDFSYQPGTKEGGQQQKKDQSSGGGYPQK